VTRAAAAAVALALALAGCGQDEDAAAPARAAKATATPTPAALFVSASGSDAGSCTPEAPCATFERAYRQAAPGDVVDVAAGEYAEQTIPAVEGRAAPSVHLRAAPGVRVAGLTVAGDHVAVSGMAVGDIGVDGSGRTVSDVELADLEATRLWVNDVRGLTVRGGSFGGVSDETPVKVGSSPSSHDITFDGVLFHDARAVSPKAHLECVLALDVQGLVVRESRFRGCGIFGLLVGHLFGTSPRDVLIEGNTFEATHQPSGEAAPYSMMVGELEGPARGFVFRDNTFATEPALLPERFKDSEMVGNEGPAPGCKPGIEYRDNVWTQPHSAACGIP
jgi:hypothetical protein